MWATSSVSEVRNPSTSLRQQPSSQAWTRRRGKGRRARPQPRPGPPPQPGPPAHGLSLSRNRRPAPRQAARGLDPNSSASRGCGSLLRCAARAPHLLPRWSCADRRRSTERPGFLPAAPASPHRPCTYLRRAREDAPAPVPVPAGGSSAPPCRPHAAGRHGASTRGSVRRRGRPTAPGLGSPPQAERDARGGTTGPLPPWTPGAD